MYGVVELDIVCDFVFVFVCLFILLMLFCRLLIFVIVVFFSNMFLIVDNVGFVFVVVVVIRGINGVVMWDFF